MTSSIGKRSQPPIPSKACPTLAASASARGVATLPGLTPSSAPSSKLPSSTGTAGGAHLILIPEIPFTVQNICDCVKRREGYGKRLTMVVVAEGIKLRRR